MPTSARSVCDGLFGKRRRGVVTPPYEMTAERTSVGEGLCPSRFVNGDVFVIRRAG